jgi:beta-lactam-binding protein with PASTA domain
VVANHAREVSVPNLAGESVDEANRLLTRVGLVLKVDQRRADPKVPADRIISQDPSRAPYSAGSGPFVCV